MRAPALRAVLAAAVLASVSWTDAIAAKAPKSAPVAAKPHPVAANARAPVRVPVRPHASNIASRSAGGNSLPALSSQAGLQLTAPHLRGAAVLGGPAKYDAKKGAVAGGAVMGHRR